MRGFEKSATHPEVYMDDMPVSLYQVIFATKIFRLDRPGHAFVPHFTGHGRFLGFAEPAGTGQFCDDGSRRAIICPGYLRWPKLFDPEHAGCIAHFFPMRSLAMAF